MEHKKQIGREAAHAAAEWWAQWFTKDAPQDSGEKRGMSPIADIMQARLALAARQRIPACGPERFKGTLVELLLRQDADSCTLSVDYDPMGLLREALALSGLADAARAFPIKTVMVIKPESVVVCCGYGKPFVQIWTALATEVL